MDRVFLQKSIEDIESQIFDGLSFPCQPINAAGYDKRMQAKAILYQQLLDVHRDLKKEDSNHDLIERVYFSSRFLINQMRHIVFMIPSTAASQWLEFGDIVKTARRQSLENPPKIEERVKQGLLYNYRGHLLAAQLEHKEGGGSASVCTNCSETIAYCDTWCPNCNYRLMDPNCLDTPFSVWRHLGTGQRFYKMKEAFGRFVESTIMSSLSKR